MAQMGAWGPKVRNGWAVAVIKLHFLIYAFIAKITFLNYSEIWRYRWEPAWLRHLKVWMGLEVTAVKL